jgi:alkylation response protein AidB-like acyl-CoA dehydrogenase
VTDFGLPDELEQLRAAAARAAAEELAPRARASEAAGRWPEAALGVLEKLALRELDVPAELGGAGLGCLAKVVLLETLAAGDAGGLAAADQPGIAAGALAACPDQGLARKVAVECLAGSAQAALAIADPAGPRFRGVTWAPSWPPLRFAFVNEGDSLRLFEVTGPLEPARALAFHASGGVSSSLAGARLLGDWRLAPGASVTLRGRARLWCAAVAVGVGQAAFDATVAYAKDRIVFGKPVAHHQGNAFELAVAVTHLAGARLAVRDAAAAFDRGAPDAGFWATQAWLSAVDAAVGVTDLGVQLLGGHGFLVDHLAEKRFREARMLCLLAGGRDSAEADVAELVLDVPDPLTN